jgi:hypothetical protein
MQTACNKVDTKLVFQAEPFFNENSGDMCRLLGLPSQQGIGINKD